MRNRRVGWCCLGLAFSLLLAGCDRTKMVTVTGTVKVDGQLLASGTITFTPADGKTQVTGGPIKDGKYSVKVPPGLMKVSLSAPRVVGTKKIYPTPTSPEMPVTVEDLPPHYNENTTLELEVTSGTIEKHFDLKRGGQPSER
jgi:hypothetical protein